MKNLIITIGILVLMSTLIVFQNDMNNFNHNVNLLEETAEEATRNIANNISEISYSEGYISFYNANGVYSIIEENINSKYWNDGVKIVINYVSENKKEEVVCIEKDVSGNIRTSIEPLNEFQEMFYRNNPRIRVSIIGYSPSFKSKFINICKFQVRRSAYCEYQGH